MNGTTGSAGWPTAPEPAILVATTEISYEEPLSNPEISQDDSAAELVEQKCPPGDAVAVYESSGRPPSKLGGANDTVTAPFEGVAATSSGFVGVVYGLAVGDVVGADGPAVFTATTSKV